MPTPPPTVFPCTLPTITFLQRLMELISRANLLKKILPSERVDTCVSSSKEAPPQKARSPSDLNTITDTSGFSDNWSMAKVSRSNRSATKELPAGCPNSTVAILFTILVYKLPFALVVPILRLYFGNRNSFYHC